MGDTKHEHQAGSVGELLAVLDVEQLDTNLFRAHNPTHPENQYTIFGGQMTAQCLRAAALTVVADRLPHSLHGYFLRPGRSDQATVLKVAVDRDGGTISSRRVTAVQDGKVIFSMAASFQAPEDGPDVQDDLPADVPRPDELETADRGRDVPEPFEFRWIAEPHSDGGISDCYWVRVVGRLPDDPLVHACVLAYVSDMGVGVGNEVRAMLPMSGAPTIDHAVWFHRPIQLDEWVLFAMRPISASGNRGLFSGSLSSEAGVLAATMTQEVLFRPQPGQGTRPPLPPVAG